MSLLSVSFNSYNCDEYARRIPLDKEYTLTWLGKTDPKICTFNFTGGDNGQGFTNYKVCFETEQYDLPSFDVELVVSNGTEKWVSILVLLFFFNKVRRSFNTSSILSFFVKFLNSKYTNQLLTACLDTFIRKKKEYTLFKIDSPVIRTNGLKSFR